MAFSKTPVLTPEMTTAAVVTVTTPALSQKEDKKPLSQNEDKKVKGQVAMHAILSGYNAASRLVLTLAPKPEEARALLHTLAAEIAAKVEAYSFHD